MAVGVSRQGSALRLRGALLACGLTLAVGLGCVASPDEGGQPSAGSAANRLSANRGCEGCHVEIAREWQSSRHRESATNAAFLMAFRSEPDPFCWDCHAPEARGDNGLDSARSRHGVACVTCHLDAHRDKPSASRPCASCHEFAFPSTARERPEMMQTTVSEHARSAFATQTCSDCHMPRVGADQHRSHALATTRDPLALRRAVQISAERNGGQLRVRIAPQGVGHAFPTGDLFRRLSVLIEVLDGTRVVRRERRYLARHFVHRLQADGVSRREEVSDDRPGAQATDAGAVVVDVDFQGVGVSQRLRWQVAYERVDHLLGDSEDGAALREAVVLAEGVVEP
jgi:hypothetical protein